MNKEILNKIIEDIPEEIEVTLVLLNGRRINLRNNSKTVLTKINYSLEDHYVKIISSVDKRQSTSFLYIPYNEIAFVEGNGILK